MSSETDAAARPENHPPTGETERSTVVDDSPLPEDRFLNRELSWLDFNARVLALAEDRDLPLLERAKFLAIFASNLDEFYMVRVAGLKRRQSMGLSVRSVDRLSPREQLARIAERTQALVERQGRCFVEEVAPSLQEQGIAIVHWQDLAVGEQPGCTITSPTTSSRCSPRSRSTRPTRSPTSAACRSTSPSPCAIRTAWSTGSPASRCPTTCRDSSPSAARAR